MDLLLKSQNARTKEGPPKLEKQIRIYTPEAQ